MKYLLLAICLSGCVKSHSHETEAVSEAFDSKYKTYMSLATQFSDTDCDWLLFESLADAAHGWTGNVEKAEGEPGQWFRTPAHDCLVTGRSASDISRDMLLGLAFYLWQTGDAQNALEVVDYAEAHGGLMGEGDESRTAILLPLLNTFESIVANRGEVPMPPKTVNPDPYSVGLTLTDGEMDALLLQTGFRAHLTVLHIFLRGLIYGELSTIELQILKSQAERQPRNAFYQATYHKFLDGDQDDAMAALMDESLFPRETLPTNKNYCESYLWQRDQGVDWEPCDQAKTHSGADFLVAATVIRNGFREGK